MGNQACVCCSDNKDQTQFVDLQVINRVEKITEKLVIPVLNLAVKKHLEHYKPFEDKLYQHTQIKKFGKDTFDGQVNQKGQPDGFGKLYYHNGCVFIGLFQNGKANGPAHFILTDGSYYHGFMQENKASTLKGQFKTNTFLYEGGFQNNKFHGAGKQKGKNYTFQGDYLDGKKVHGLLKWDEIIEDQKGEKGTFQMTYKGHFNSEGQFTGTGYIMSYKGQYHGNFLKGKKHGKGIFKFKNETTYEGEYFEDMKHGEGTLFKKNRGIAYSGEWANGLPNGKGFVVNQHGNKIHLKWKQGLDENIVPSQNIQQMSL